MRKALALFTVMFISCIGLFSAAFIELDAEKDNVVVTEKVVYGDKSYAENVTLTLNSRYNSNLKWKTEYTISDKPTTKTEFDFSKAGFESVYDAKKSIGIGTYVNFTTTATEHDGITEHAGIYENIVKAYYEMLENAEPYVNIGKNIYLADYYDYYPLSIDISFPDKYNLSNLLDTKLLSKADIAVVKAFNDFFKIPIVEGDMIGINAMIDESGNITQWGTSWVEEAKDSYSVYINSEITDSTCLFAFTNRTEEGNLVDTSLIPGGYGIYALPYSETENSVVFDFDNMKNVYPIDEKIEVYEIKLTDNKKELYIMTRDGNKSVLIIIDAETYETKHTLEVADFSDGAAYIYQINDNFILFDTYRETVGESFYTAVSIDDKGELTKEFTVEIYNYGGTVKWDGEYLYVASEMDHGFNLEASIIMPCGFTFSVYDKNGIQFHGEYNTSLSTGNDKNYASNYYVFTNYGDAVDFELPA